MARIKSTTRVGATMREVDVDAPTFAAAILNAQGDLALTYDMLSGENGETNTINHSGSGRGCPLGAPLMNCAGIDALLTVVGGSLPGVNVDAVYLAAVPIRIPAGEESLEVRISFTGLSPSDFPRGQLIVRNLSWVSQGAADLVALPPVYDTRFQNYRELSGTLEGLTPGQYIALVRIDDVVATQLASWSIHGVSFYWSRARAGGPWGYAQGSDADDVGVLDPGTSPMSWQDFDDDVIEPEQGLNSHILTAIDQNANALAEYLCGVPAGGNSTFVHIDSGATAPTRSEFFAHARAGFASEPEIDFPFYAQVHGAIAADVGKEMVVVNDTEPPTTGMTGFYSPWTTSATGAGIAVSLWNGRLRAPHFQTSSSRLTFAALFVTDNTGITIGNWSVSIECGGASVICSLSVVPGTNNRLWLATRSGVAFLPDAINSCAILASCSVARGVREFCLVGSCWSWEA